jgi:hypothetical protein
LNTIYSTTGIWQTIGNYDERQFYQKVSRSNGDGVIDDLDNSVFFNTALFPDGSYLLRIHAYDAAANHSSTELEVIIDNYPTSLNDFEATIPELYPNPSNGLFNIKTNGISISRGEICNNLGVVISSLDNISTDGKDITIDVPGIYFVRLFGSDNQLIITEKIIIQN